MQFSTRRVEVHGQYGLLYRAHPQQASRMIADGQAEFLDTKSIRVTGALSLAPRESRPSSNSCVSTRRERMPDGGILIQHKYIHAADAPIYRMAVTDCVR